MPDDSSSQQDCPICFDAFDGSRRIGACQPCGHVFHIECYRAWADSRSNPRVKCPMCQRRIDKFTRLFLTMNSSPSVDPLTATTLKRTRDEVVTLRASLSTERRNKESLDMHISQLRSEMKEKDAALKMHSVQLSSKTLEAVQAINALTVSRNEQAVLQQKNRETVQQAQNYIHRLEQEYQSQTVRLTTRLSQAENQLEALDIVQEAFQILTESQVKTVQWQSTDANLHVNKVQSRWEGLRDELQFLASQLETVSWVPGTMVSQMAQNVVVSANALVSQCESQIQAAHERRKTEIETMKDKFLHHYMHPIGDKPDEPSSREEASSGHADDKGVPSKAKNSTDAVVEPRNDKVVSGPIYASKTLKAPPPTTTSKN